MSTSAIIMMLVALAIIWAA
ncbi:MetS family NSS transporter small subunit [Pasteurella canis]